MYHRLRNWGKVLRGLVLVAALSLAACSPLDLLGGPNVAANVQAGAENNQGINTNIEAPRAETKGNVGKIDQSVINNNEANPLLIGLLILGWLLPSPGEMGRGFVNLFRRKQ